MVLVTAEGDWPIGFAAGGKRPCSTTRAKTRRAMNLSNSAHSARAAHRDGTVGQGGRSDKASGFGRSVHPRPPPPWFLAPPWFSHAPKMAKPVYACAKFPGDIHELRSRNQEWHRGRRHGCCAVPGRCRDCRRQGGRNRQG